MIGEVQQLHLLKLGMLMDQFIRVIWLTENMKARGY